MGADELEMVIAAREAARNDAEQAKINKALEYMSHSRLSAYNGCGEKFRLSYVERVDKAASGFFIGGIAVHETIEESEKEHTQWYPERNNFEKPNGVGYQFFQDRMSDLIKRMGPDIYWGGRGGSENEQWWRVSGPMMLRRYHEVRLADLAMGWQVSSEASEVTVWAELPGGRKLQVKIDAFMMVDDNGERCIRDYKSGKVGGSDPVQMATYSWAVRNALNLTVDRTHFVYLRAKEASKRIDPLDVSELREMVPMFYANLEAFIRAGHFPLRPSWNCKSCAVRKHCAYGQQLDKEIEEEAKGAA